ncbi:MAG TPA: alkaline phosphatase family protein [Blastocatellia bacterium]|jgi:predicted AlkP superfamily phosphohydrolase/phosphomutase|nr:alkaline phosphatase family protein [Blastocatellia bacterium]
MKPRILVIGLDAATFDLIEPWSERGALPSLTRLMEEGTRARMRSTPNMHSASAWTSILTGLNPGRHGLFVFSDRDCETGRHMFFKGGDRTGQTLGGYLNHAGLTTGFVNVPMTYPAECVADGFMISGLDAPSLDEKAFCPVSLRDELLERYPAYAYGPSGLGDLMRRGQIDKAIQAWTGLIRTQTEACIYLLNARQPEFFMTVYTASDWGGHNLWRFERAAPSGSPAPESEAPLLDIYKALDAAVGKLLELAADGTQVYVISDHGMGRHTGASYHLAAWLESKRYMVRSAQSRPVSSSMKQGLRRIGRKLPSGLKDSVKSALGRERLEQIQTAEKDSFYSSIDWERTTAYSEPGRHIININLGGRSPRGIVTAADYESICDKLSRDLAAWSDSSGHPVVERVARRDESYHGPFVERASDLYVYWNGEASLGDPPAEVKERGFWWNGDHRPEGILICKGPGIRKGEGVSGCNVYDLAPTLMHLAGLPVPSGMDGRVIEPICTDDFRSKNPIRAGAFEKGAEVKSEELGDAEEELMAEKLRSLGYL